MKDYFAILGVDPKCSVEEIRRAYRSQAKNLHPDRIGDAGTTRFLAIKEAYEVLSSALTRESYTISRKAAGTGTGGWTYRDFLHARKDEPDFLAKLICYDLLHDQEFQAIELVDNAEGFFSLREHLNREDFMDYGFLLAEAYMEQGALIKAYRLLRRIAVMEQEKPYFKFFYIEVLNKLELIVRHPIPEDTDNRLRIVLLGDLLALPYAPKREGRLRKLLSELLAAAGNHEESVKEIFRAWSLAPGIPGLAESVKNLRRMGIEPED